MDDLVKSIKKIIKEENTCEEKIFKIKMKIYEYELKKSLKLALMNSFSLMFYSLHQDEYELLTRIQDNKLIYLIREKSRSDK